MSINLPGPVNADLNSNESSNLVKQPVSPQDGNNPIEQTQKGLEDDAQTQPQHLEPLNEKNFNHSPKERLPEDPKDQEIYEEKVKPDLMACASESPDKTVSLTNKALRRMEDRIIRMKRLKKAGKISLALKKKKLNDKLYKLLIPKSAISLLNELKPDCGYKFLEMSGAAEPSFCVQIEHNNVILGVGQGSSKAQAKNFAAESAIKTIVLKAMSQQPSNATETDGSNENSVSNLPWAGLASFAMFKMFSDWKVENTALLSMTRHTSKQKSKPKLCLPERKLPPNASELHPSAVLNIMYPGLTAVEIERKGEPMSQVKMGYKVNGKMYTGVAGNKKDAKKEAAKAVLLSLHGVFFKL